MNQGVKKRKRDDSEHVDGEPSRRSRPGSRHQYDANQQRDGEQLSETDDVLDLSGKMISSFTELKDICWKHRDVQKILLRDIFHRKSSNYHDDYYNDDYYNDYYYNDFYYCGDPYYESESESESERKPYSYCDSDDDSAGGGFYDDLYKTKVCHVQDSSDRTSNRRITLLEELKQICPGVRSIDITGCGHFARAWILAGFYPIKLTAYAGIRKKLSKKLGIEIIDSIEENPVLRDFLTPNLLEKPEVKSTAKQIEELVRNGTPADSSINGWTLLHSACALGDVQLVEFLLQRVGPKGGNTCSERPWKFSKRRIRRTFLSKRVSTGDKLFGFPPPCIIVLACYHHQLFDLFKADIICELLISSPHHFTNLANIMLIDRIEFSYEADTEYDIDSFYHSFNTKALRTPHFNLKEVIQWLCDILCLQQQQRQALLEALLLGATTTHYEDNQTIEESVEFLLNLGCIVPENFSTKLVSVPLLTPLLVKHGCEIQGNQTDEHGKTRLHYTVEKVDEEVELDKMKQVCQLLLDCGADINAKDDKGKVPVVTCMMNGITSCQLLKTVNMCTWLIEKGADGNALIHWRYKGEGDSFLHCVLRKIGMVGSIDVLKEICKLLLDLGVDINTKNGWGETPIVSCLRWGLENWHNISDTPHSEGEHKTLEKEMTDRQTREELQSCSAVVNMCNWLIERGADKTAVKEHTCGKGRSFFHYVVSKINEVEPLDAIKDACKLLINCGTDINQENNCKHSETPLYQCFIKGILSCLNEEKCTEETTKCDGMEPNGQPQNMLPCNTLNMCSWLIGNGANPLSLKGKLKRDKFECTLMHLVFMLMLTEGNYIHLIKELCLFLLKHGADINAKDIGGFTPLMHCIRWGLQISPAFDAKYAEFINGDISSNETEMEDENQLSQSQPQVNSFVVNMCKWLIESGANVNVDMLTSNKYDQGNTPLHCATQAVRETESSDAIKKVCKLLLEHGADINARNRKGETPLLRCIRYSLRHWDQGDHVESPAREGSSEGGCAEMTDDGPVSAQAELGPTPSCSNTVNICNWLIELGADVNSVMLNQVYHNRNTLLHRALFNICGRKSCDKLKEVCKLLLDHGADVNARNSVGETPIATCIKAGLINEANWQIERENIIRTEEGTANQNKKAVKEVEPCHYFSTVQMCSWLVESGSDVNMRFRYSQTVYHVIVTSLLQLYVFLMDNEQSFATCTYKNLIAFLCGITNASVSVNSRDDNGNSPLHLFVKHAISKRRQFANCSLEAEENIGLINAEYLELFNCLLSHGSKVNAVNDDQRSPLHLASGFHTCTATALLDAGALPNLKDKDGSTPLLTWVSSGINSSKAEWEMMLNRGMDPFVANEACETVFGTLLLIKKPHQTKLFLEAVKAVDSMNLNKLDSNGDSMLHVLGGHKIDSVQDIFVLLLKLGADPNKLNSRNQTPLHILCRRIVSCLTEEENEEKEMAKEGKPTEDIILDSGFDWAISALKKYGAKPDILDSRGQTCIDFAENHNLTKLKALLEKPMDQIVIPPLLPWIQQSDKHKSLLGQVARHQKSKQIELLHYNTQPIGNGAFGVVYAGIHEKDGREVAVKKISLPIQRFDHPGNEREIKNLLQLKDCEHIVKYYNYCLTEDSLYIIFELMDGDLEELICPEREIVKLCRNVMDGLSYLHSKKVLHRDIKPGNVLYKTHPTLCLKLADFGLSKEESAMAAASVTVMHSKVGTRCWMAAEVHKTVEYSEESDVFSAGLVLHYILTEKKHAFEPGDTGKTFAEIQHKIEGNILKGKSNLSESLSPEASNLLEGMLSHNKIDRPKAAASLRHPYFWSKKSKKDFLCAVANQPEIQEPRHIAASRGLSSVEQELETALGSEFVSNPWNGKIPAIFSEVTSKGRRYSTTSAVDLLRFVRNSYAHVSDKTRPTGFKKELLEKYVYFDKFPTLLITLYRAVMLYKWDARDEIKSVIESELQIIRDRSL